MNVQNTMIDIYFNIAFISVVRHSKYAYKIWRRDDLSRELTILKSMVSVK